MADDIPDNQAALQAQAQGLEKDLVEFLAGQSVAHRQMTLDMIRDMMRGGLGSAVPAPTK